LGAKRRKFTIPGLRFACPGYAGLLDIKGKHHGLCKLETTSPEGISGALLIAVGWSQDAGAQGLESERCPDAIIKSIGKFFALNISPILKTVMSQVLQTGD
jgi:hypothetical protein